MNGTDDTLTDAPDPTFRHPGGIIGALTEVFQGEGAVPAAEHLDHVRTIRRHAEREARGRARQQDAIGWLITALAIEVPTVVALFTWGLYTGSLFR